MTLPPRRAIRPRESWADHHPGNPPCVYAWGLMLHRFPRGATNALNCRVWVTFPRPCRRRGCNWGGGPDSCGLGRSAWLCVEWRGVAGGYLHVAQVDAGVEHRGHERVPQHVRMHPGGVHPGDPGEAVQAAGGAVPVHLGAGPGAQDRPALPVTDGALDGTRHRRWQRGQQHLPALAPDPEDPVAVLLAEVLNVRPGRLEDPQHEQAQHRHQSEVVEVRRVASGDEHRFELQVRQA